MDLGASWSLIVLGVVGLFSGALFWISASRD